jgi:DNA-binding NtrC family response regulator
MNKKIKILVIDDDAVVRHSLLRVLAEEHCEVEQAWSGELALQTMARQAFDIVLLDLRMPGMNGVAVLERIKQQWPETEVIVITGHPEIETAKQAIRLGAYDYLSKPLGPDEVIDATRGALQHKGWALHTVQAAFSERGFNGVSSPAVTEPLTRAAQ